MNIHLKPEPSPYYFMLVNPDGSRMRMPRRLATVAATALLWLAPASITPGCATRPGGVYEGVIVFTFCHDPYHFVLVEYDRDYNPIAVSVPEDVCARAYVGEVFTVVVDRNQWRP